jgi:hypothetical protein
MKSCSEELDMRSPREHRSPTYNYLILFRININLIQKRCVLGNKKIISSKHAAFINSLQLFRFLSADFSISISDPALKQSNSNIVGLAYKSE